MIYVDLDTSGRLEDLQARKLQAEIEIAQAKAKLAQELAPYAAQVEMRPEDFAELVLMRDRDPEAMDELMRNLASSEGVRMMLRAGNK
jgi:hypothetical protein